MVEARNRGVVPFCVTIDREGASYLPHLFGPAGCSDPPTRRVARTPAHVLCPAHPLEAMPRNATPVGKDPSDRFLPASPVAEIDRLCRLLARAPLFNGLACEISSALRVRARGTAYRARRDPVPSRRSLPRLPPDPRRPDRSPSPRPRATRRWSTSPTPDAAARR